VLIGRRKIDAAAIGGGVGIVQAIGAGADDAAVDDEFEKVMRRSAEKGKKGLRALLARFERAAGEKGDGAIGETDTVLAGGTGGSFDDDGDCTGFMKQCTFRRLCVGKSDDLRANEDDVTCGRMAWTFAA
jgi:hypothetical protein